MGKFDIVYIYKVLEDYNLQLNKKHYDLSTNYKDNKMLKLVIKIKLNKKKYIKITLIDSYNILIHSLDDLNKDFNLKYLKGHLTYILGLLEVLEKFKTYLFIEHNLELTEGLTISRLALNKYFKNYIKDSKLPLINKFNIFNFMHLGYYGGRTEVFKPYGKNLYYYDINSLYPHVALKNMPGLESSYIKNFSNEGINLDKIFGIFKAKVKTNNLALGLLPIKTQLGLIFPNGEYEGI